MPLEQGDTLPAVQAQHLVRLHEVSLGVAAGLGVRPGAGVDRGEQGHEGHLIIGDGNRHLAALLRDVLGRGEVVTAHIQCLVKSGQLIFPLLPRILFLPLGQALHHDLAAHIEAADAVEGIGDALHVADVAVFIQTEVDQHRQTAILTMEPGIVGEPGERQ